MSSTALFNHGYALLVGFGEGLPTTVRDATALRDILIDTQRCAYPPNQVKLITEAQATRQGILDGLDWLIAQTKEDASATAVVYYSGHGGFSPTYHLVAYGYNGQSDTAVSGLELTEKLATLQAKKLLVLLDCCHAAGMAEVKNFVKSPTPPELEAILTEGSGRVVIASSRKSEVSYPGVPYSVFTQALREGLAGYGASEQDGYAYVADVALYVGHVVPDRTNDKQHPVLKLAETDNFAVAYYAGGAKSPNPLAGVQAIAGLAPVVEQEIQVTQDQSALDSTEIEEEPGYDEERKPLSEELHQHKRNLHQLRLQRAKFGTLHVPIYLLNQIQDEEKEIVRIQALLKPL